MIRGIYRTCCRLENPTSFKLVYSFKYSCIKWKAASSKKFEELGYSSVATAAIVDTNEAEEQGTAW